MPEHKSLGELGISASRIPSEQNDTFKFLCTIPNDVCFARVKSFYAYGLRYEVEFDDGTRRAFPIVIDKNMNETFSVVEHEFVVIDKKRYARIVITIRDVDIEASHEIGKSAKNPERQKPIGRPKKNLQPPHNASIASLPTTQSHCSARKRKVIENADTSDCESEDENDATTYDGNDVVFIDNKPTVTKRHKVQSIIKCKTKSIFCKQPIIRKTNDNSYVAECEFPCTATLHCVALMITDDKMYLLDGKGSHQTQIFSFKLPTTVANGIISADYSFEDKIVDGTNITSLKIYIECDEE